VILFPGDIGTDGRERTLTLDQSDTVSEVKKILSMTAVLRANKFHKAPYVHFERRRTKQGPRGSLFREYVRTLHRIHRRSIRRVSQSWHNHRGPQPDE
jgi:hypothetical protein